MKTNRCINCMNELEEHTERCPYCQTDQKNPQMASFALENGTILQGQYLVGGVIGQGGFGITYVGYDLRLNKKVAIKEYYPKESASRYHGEIYWSMSREEHQLGCSLFIEEARRMAKIDEIPSVVRVLNTFYENSTAYIIMDFVDGHTLRSIVKKNGPMTFDQCMQIMTPCLDALAILHEKKIIHRDISPDNIMIRPDSKVRVLDLGASKEVNDFTNGAHTTNLIVKHGYSPVEMYSTEGRIGPWTDMYALCATMYFCLTGKNPVNVLKRATQKLPLDWPDSVRNTVDEKIIKVIEKGMALNIEDRFQSVSEFKESIKAAQSKEKNPKIRSGRSGLVKIVGVVAALAVVAGLSYQAYHMLNKELTVVSRGQTGANQTNGEFWLLYKGYEDHDYEYYTDCNSDLYLIASEDSTFYINADILPYMEKCTFLTKGESWIYYVHENEDHSSDVYRMRPDGKELKEVFHADGSITYLNYYKFSDQSEYLYYIDENDKNLSAGDLSRYDLHTDTQEFIHEKVMSYGFSETSLFYTYMNDTPNEYALLMCQSEPDGKKAATIKENELLYFVDDGMIYTISIFSLEHHVYDYEGKKRDDIEPLSVATITEISNIGYGEGWFYYTDPSDHTPHKVRTNGKNDVQLADFQANGEFIVAPTELFCRCEVLETPYLRNKQLRFINLLNNTYFDVRGPQKEYLIDVENADSFSYEAAEDGNGIIITGYQGQNTVFTVPESIDGLNVTGIGDNAFAGLEVETIVLPEGVTKIGESAFFKCKKLQQVYLPNTLTEVQYAAFGECDALQSITFPESLEIIGEVSFANARIWEVHIPKNVKEIGPGAFAEDEGTGLTEFTVDEENPVFFVEDGVLYETIEGGNTRLVAYPVGKKDKEYSIRSDAEIVDAYTFSFNPYLEHVVFPDPIRVYINDEEFYSKTTVIKEWIFLSSNALKSISVCKSQAFPENWGKEDLEIEVRK